MKCMHIIIQLASYMETFLIQHESKPYNDLSDVQQLRHVTVVCVMTGSHLQLVTPRLPISRGLVLWLL